MIDACKRNTTYTHAHECGQKGKNSGTTLLIRTPLPLPIVFSFGTVGVKKPYSISTTQLSTFFLLHT
jgi:hypothetical protein